MNKMKIASLVVGAALAASAVSAVSLDDAGLKNYRFFTNGQPAVKLVVGSKAAPSDGVVAANIAAMLGNLAYTQQTVSIVGKEGLTCGGANGTAGSCSVDATSKKVTFAVTYPGASPANVYTMKTYINDYLDNSSETVRSTSGILFDGDPAKVGWADRLTSDKSAVLALPNNGMVSNGYGRNVQQTQEIYVGAFTKYDTTQDAVVAYPLRADYKLAFSDPLPACWDTSLNYSSCTSTDQLDGSHTYIWFLGQKWVVTDLTFKANGYDFQTLKIGKESAYSSQMNVDDEIVAPNGVKVKLTSVTPTGLGGNNLPRASFQITHADGVTTELLALDEGTDKLIQGVTVKVNKVFSGYNTVNYADVSVFSDVLTLEDGKQVDTTGNKNWYVTLGSANTSSSQGLANITLWNTYPQNKDMFLAGESLNILSGSQAFNVKFQGLSTVDSDHLVVHLVQNVDTRFNSSSGAVWTGTVAEVASDQSNAFQYNSVSSNKVRIAMEPLTSTATYLGTAPIGTVLVQDTNGNWYPAAGTAASPTATTATYQYSSTESTVMGVTGNSTAAAFWIKDYSEDNQANTANYIIVYYDNTKGNGEWSNGIGSTDNTKIAYRTYGTTLGTGANNTVATLNASTNEVNFVTDRGAVFKGMSTTDVSFDYPKVPVKAIYTLQATGTNATAGAVTCSSVAVGGTCQIDTGYTATVTSIDANAGGAAGSSGSCSLTGDTGLSASPATAATVVSLDTSATPLVVMDSTPVSGQVVVVGGPAVNTMAASSGLPSAPGDGAMVKVDGGKIYVAGYSAQDTMDAGNALIAWLGTNRASVTG